MLGHVLSDMRCKSKRHRQRQKDKQCIKPCSSVVYFCSLCFVLCTVKVLRTPYSMSMYSVRVVHSGHHPLRSAAAVQSICISGRALQSVCTEYSAHTVLDYPVYSEYAHTLSI